MQIVAVTIVPAITCPKVCFFNTILDHPMKGEKRKRSRTYGEKIYPKVIKRRVEYVICPLIFQKNVTMVITDATTKSAREISVKVGILYVFNIKNNKPKRSDTVIK